uniref:SPRY domain-containing protein 7 n=1 Tax=Macrostomum lignano TaxID=282301 RepID=A0A1I8JBA8_9PLAT
SAHSRWTHQRICSFGPASKHLICRIQINEPINGFLRSLLSAYVPGPPVTLAPPVQLDNATMGQGVVLVKNGRRICGTGAARANCPVSQDKAYWEVKLQSCGSWGIGLGTVRCDLESPNNLGSDAESWALRDDAAIYHGNQPVAKLPDPVQEGDVIGLTYDHVTLEVFLNGKPMHTPVTGIRGTVFPTFYVDDGAILDCAFAAFAFGPPAGFRELIKEKQLL